jgi:hypothetical protein
MAWSEGTGPSSGATKRLFKPARETLLRADFGTVESPGTASVCGVEYPKRSTDFDRCRPGWFSGSKLFFKVV